ncbi:SWIM zinc finger family protein [Heyndrickxia coagulans]|uniref:SWIM zinc finger family protein n=1 Tax=Heyndrickxia coagulans TaxID=1398 RepID=UPI0023E35CC4|nr:SWIM zinc finger family protein [Heyndrickxia coagulans]
MAALLNDYAKKLQNHLQPERDSHQKLVQKGLLLYRQHLVHDKRISGRFLRGKVQDVTPVDCGLDLFDPLFFDCSCPHDGFCRHLMALFFSAYSEENSVFDWVGEWKRRSTDGDILQSVKRASDLLEKKAETSGQNISMWLDDFHTAFEEINVNDEFLLDLSAREVYRRLTLFLSVEREWEPLYKLTAAYELFKYINTICLKNDFFSSTALMQFLSGEAEEAANQLSSAALPFVFDPFIAYFRENTRELAESVSLYELETVDFYRILWSRLLKKENWRKEEEARLRKEILNSIDAGENLSSTKVLCFIHLAFLLGNDDTALFFLRQLAQSGVNTAVYMPYWFLELKADERLFRYISAALPMIPRLLETCGDDYDKAAYMRMFFRSINEQALSAQQLKLLEKLYRAFLPVSAPKYGDILFLSARYREWAELQTLIGNTPEDMAKEKLERVAKQAPEVLLPLYHRAVGICIGEKNRKSYQKAVRYLKKLKAIYRKRHEEERWYAFFDEIKERTKRMRAFQEECRRGNLTDADGI